MSERRPDSSPGHGIKPDHKPVIVALDFPAPDPLFNLLQQLDPVACRVKVGKELFTACGPDLLRRIHDLGFDVFLDLKFHDIPSTVAGAVRAAAGLGVWMVNVHAVGGQAMLEAAREAADSAVKPPLLTGVTVLTSLDENDLRALGITNHLPDEDYGGMQVAQKTSDGRVRAQVLRLTKLCAAAKLDGIICSAAETALVHDYLLYLRSFLSCVSDPFCLITPGIRRPEDMTDDQKRIVTPAEAIKSGSTHIVVGRPITRAPDPAAALAAFNGACPVLL